MLRKSDEVISKKESSKLSKDESFAVPETSISLLLSKHSPKILCITFSNFDCSSLKNIL